ncbi:hypothetical protein GCN74_20865 [Janthinobacterium sp. FT14W]|uniref:Rap1a/Tai family immunity protein n=1 Tax=Janthinobacterium sp. FT14W TaxID=2654253 RepID=UPI001264B460|nr:Rap1a/Tai family immunity protein [Janthinobacterium sp. FT14W]KAB8057341.1 hypothetical protein GCN74_20865 [Janthinobacterium sp. FT14W]
MRHVVPLAALCASALFAPASAAGYPPAPRLSADQLIAYYQERRPAGEAPDPAFLLDQRYAKGYLAGVADAAQGRQWCDTGRLKTVEIDALLVAGLERLPARVRQGDAAALIVAILARRFPCSTPPSTGG